MAGHQKRNPTTSTHRARGEITRRAILDAAATIFARDGLAGARTESIATEANVNKALIFYYFKDLNELYTAVLEDQFRDLQKGMIDVLTGPGSPREIMLRYIDFHFEAISQRRKSAQLHQQFMAAADPFVVKLLRKYAQPRNRAFRRLMVRGIREREFRPVDPHHAAISIVGVIVFFFSIAPVLKTMGYANAYSEANLRVRKQQVLDFVRHALFTDPAAPLP